MRTLKLILLVGLTGALTVRAETPLVEVRAALDKWVETRQLTSKTRIDWQSDKEMLEQSLQLFDRELKSLEAEVAKLDTNSTQVEKERKQAEALLKSSDEGLDQGRIFAADFEGKVATLVPRLPAPLQDILKPLLARMPTNSLSTKMAVTERIQVLVGILNELDKFNNAVTLFSEKRRNDKGDEVAVEAVYVGLGAAYFVNDAGDFAGIGSPGTNGWEWDVTPGLAPAVKEVIQIYRNEHPAKFVALPVSIK